MQLLTDPKALLMPMPRTTNENGAVIRKIVDATTMTSIRGADTKMGPVIKDPGTDERSELIA